MKFLADIEVEEGLKDSDGDLGTGGQVLSSTGTGTNWIDASSGSIGGSITDNQIAVGATTANNIEGSSGLTWSGSLLDVDGNVQLDGQLNFTSSINRIFSENNTGFDFYLNNIRVGDLNKISTSGGQWLIYQYLNGNNAKQFPGYSFAANTTTGMFLEDTAILAFSTAGESRLIIGSTGDVGIGTGVDAATQRLHVVGSARVTGAYYDSTNSAGSNGQVLSSTNSGTTTAWVAAGGGGGSIGGSIAATQVAFGSATSNEITGENDLVYTNLNGLTIGAGAASSANSILNMNKGASGQCRLQLKNQNTTRFDIKLDGVEDSYITAFNTLTLGTGDTNKHIILNPAGFVGVGTTSPTKELTVNGTIYSEQASGEVIIAGNSSYLTKYITIREGANYAARWGLQANDGMVTSGVALMSSAKPIAFRASNNIAFASITDSHLIIRPAAFGGVANVGIGTDDPQSKLQVAGGVQIANDTAADNISTKAGTLRYREDVNIGTPKASNTFIDMYMRTEDSTYEWVNIVTNNW